jgi:hypothetical protein
LCPLAPPPPLPHLLFAELKIVFFLIPQAL